MGSRAARVVTAAPEVAPRVETGREWATNGNGHAVAAPAPAAAPRKRRFHPVLLVALYAAVGIGAIVLVSTVLFGNSSAPSPAPQPASNTTPKAAPTSDPELTGTLADETSDGEFKLNAEPDTKRHRRPRARRAGTSSASARGPWRPSGKRRGLQGRRRAPAGGRGPARPATAAVGRRRHAGWHRRRPLPTQGGGGGGGGGGGPGPAPRPRPTCEFCIG